MAEINCGTLYGYQNNNTRYGAFTVYFLYDGVIRSGTNVTIQNPKIQCVSASTEGYTTNTIFINSVSVNGTDLGISGQFNGKSYHKSKWTSESVGNKDVYAESYLTSLTVSISCGRTAAQYNQTLTGTVSVDAGNYIVSYNANGGIGAPTSQTKEHNKTLTLSTVKPNKVSTSTTGYTITLNANGGYVSTLKLTQYNTTSYSFKSWITNSSGTGTTYNSGGSYSANADATLYAIWNTSITKGSVTLPTPARAKYSFVGWGTMASATTGVTGTITPTSSQTLYAIWKRTLSLVNWRDSTGNFTSGGTISVKDSNSRWVVINKLNIKNSSGVFEEH